MSKAMMGEVDVSILRNEYFVAGGAARGADEYLRWSFAGKIRRNVKLSRCPADSRASTQAKC